MARKTQKPGRKIRVFLVDDHPAVRRGLELLLSREPDLEVCGQAAGARNALKQVLAREPDLAIVDLTLREGNGLKLIADLRAHHPKLRIVVFSMHEQAHTIREAFKAGANGYLTKDEGAAKLIEAIRAVMRGDSFLTKPAASAQGQAATGCQAREQPVPYISKDR